MNKKLTPWFPGNVKPKRVGYYQTEDRDLPGDTYYNLWDGYRWYYGDWTLSDAVRWEDNEEWPKNAASLKRWRGLAEKP